MKTSRVVPFALLAMMPAFLLGNSCGPTTVASSAPVRFVLVARNAGGGPLYVKPSASSGQPGWISVSRADRQPVYLAPRCEIPDCRNPTAVCGMQVPLIRDIAGSNSIEYVWDGTESVLDAASGCQSQRAAPAGDYVATFCYARQAETSGGDASQAVRQGVLVAPVCREVPFQLPSRGDVTFEVPSGD